LLIGRRSIFNRLVLAFFVVGLITGVPLVLLSIEFNKRSNEVRLRQSVGQQIAIIEDNFRQEFSVGLLRSLRQVTESDSLVGYLLASRDERIIKAKALEKHLLGLQGAYKSYTGIYYVDGEGEFVVDVVNGQRSDVWLFGTFFVVALADIVMSEIRGKRPDYIPRVRSDIIAVVVGLVLYAVFLFGFHPYVLNVPVV
jgi:hypothetical protein